MHKITQAGSKFEITNYPWDENGYKPQTMVQISYDNDGFNIHFTSYESEIHAERTEHNTDVCCDSCMELFVQFDPDNDTRYINIEANPNAAVLSAIGPGREGRVPVPASDIELLGAKAQISDDKWEVSYCIPVSFIQKYVPTYRHKAGNIIRANFYKCGDEAKYPHYGCFAHITNATPDFHRPEFFTEFELA